MTKIFTDEEGIQYEIVEYSDNSIFTVIKPLKEDKQTYWSLWFQPDGEDRTALFSEKVTEDQAKKVAEAIEALMEYITMPLDRDSLTYINVVNKAREAFNEDN